LTIKKVVDKIAECDVQVLIVTEKDLEGLSMEKQGTKSNILYDAMKTMGGRIVEG